MCFCGPSGVSVCQPCLVLVEVVEALVEPMFWRPHAFPVFINTFGASMVDELDRKLYILS